MQWDSSNGVKDSSMVSIFHSFINGQNLLQVAREATRKTAFLDPLLTSRSFGQCDVISLPQIAGSDHSAQLLRLKAVKRTNLEDKDRLIHHIRYENVVSIMSSVDWPSTFSTCVTTDDYANCFTNILHETIDMSSYFKPACKRKCLPRHIVKLLHSKRRAWLSTKRSGDFTSHKTLCRTVRSAICQHTKCLDLRLVYSNDRKSFFKHLSSKLRSHRPHINITVNGISLNDNQAAEAFLQEFSSKFTNATSSVGNQTIGAPPFHDPLSNFNCSQLDVIGVINICTNSLSSPNGITFRLLKAIAVSIAQPLTIIYQHSFHDAVFPSSWKQAVVVPLYKGRGKRDCAGSYRPISLCQCLGKLLEKIVHLQLSNYHPFDIVSFDFKKACDKTFHEYVIQAASNIGINGKALDWLTSFLYGRTQKVRIGNSHSRVNDVTSGVIQGSSLGPDLYTIFINSLIHYFVASSSLQLHLPTI